MQTVESVSDTRFIATQKLVAGDTHMDLPEVLFHARDDGLTSHADIPPAIVPFDEVDVIRRCLRFQVGTGRRVDLLFLLDTSRESAQGVRYPDLAEPLSAGRSGQRCNQSTHFCPPLLPLPIEEPCDRTPFSEFRFGIMRRHLWRLPPACILHINNRSPCLGERDSTAYPQRMTTDESFNTRSFGTGLDYPPS